MNKVIYWTFFNLPVKIPVFVISAVVLGLSFGYESDQKDKEITITKGTFQCIDAPVMTDDHDKYGNNVFSCNYKK